jgi:parvulin-like peptidyl-prolyl isomerase
MSRRRIALFGIVLALASAQAGAQQKVVEEIVAVVNDEVITLSDVVREYAMRLEAVKAQFQGEELEKIIEQIREQLLDTMITDMLVLQLAKEKSINVSDQVRMAIDNVKKQNNLESDDELKRALASQGMDWDSWIRQVEQTSLQQAVLYGEVNRSIVLDDAEIVDYYKKNPKEFTTPEEYTLRAVYLATLDAVPADLEAKKKEVEAKAKAGGDFTVLAETFGDPPLKEAKGDLGTIKQGELDPTLQKAVEGLKKGEVSGWVETKNGWYLLKMEDKKDRRLLSFEEAKKLIEEKIFIQKQNAKMEEFIAGIKKKAFIKILKPKPLEDIR